MGGVRPGVGVGLRGSSHLLRGLRRGGSDMRASRLAVAIITTVLSGYTLNTVITVWRTHLDGPGLLSTGLALLVVSLLQLLHSLHDTLGWSRRAVLLTLPMQAAAVFIAFIWIGPQAAAAAGFLAGSMLIAVRGPARWLLYAGVGAVVGLVLSVKGMASIDIVYGTYFTLLTGLVVYGISALARQVMEVLATRGDVALMAVTQERLRVARDLHDMIGHQLSAITLGGEVAYRLLPMRPERAREELRRVMDLAQRTQSEMRVITGGVTYLSLSAELDSVVATLSCAGIDSEVDVGREPLAAELDTVLALVLREAVTNVLRHSKALRCAIICAEQDGVVRLRVGNDGAGAKGGSCDGGIGLDNLATRLSHVGGHLAVPSEEAEWFWLVAEIPLAGRQDRKAAPGEEPPAEGGRATRMVGHAGPRATLGLALVIIVGYGLVVLVNILGLAPAAPALAGASACLGVGLAVQAAISLGRPRQWRVSVRVSALALLAAASFAPLWWIGQPWGSMGGFLAGSILLVGTGLGRWIGYLAVVAAVAGAGVVVTHEAETVAYLVISTMLTGLVVYGISTLYSVVCEVHAARQELAKHAVMRERLQLTRDLHDLLDQKLSEMALTSELVHRLLPGSVEVAKTELEGIVAVARQATAEVRSVASGYKHMSLSGELDSAATKLSAMGVEVRTAGPAADLPAGTDAVLAVVVRKVVAEVPKQRELAGCAITCFADARAVNLSIRLDGLAPGADLPAYEDMLDELRERLECIGGTLTVADSGRELAVIAEAPVQPLPGRAEGNLPRGIAYEESL